MSMEHSLAYSVNVDGILRNTGRPFGVQSRTNVGSVEPPRTRGRKRLDAGKPAFDAFGDEYARLAFGIERHAPGFIDAYLGPEDTRAAIESGPAPPPEELVVAARELLAQVPELPASETRQGYVAKQVEAMLTIARRLAGEELPYREEVRLLFDTEPTPTPESTFDAVATELDHLLPGDGPVSERMIAWRASYAVAPEVARRLVDVILPELRARTSSIIELPEGEAVEIRLVRDQPWSGYNWYLGDGRSRVEINTDLPIYAYRLTTILAHEAYPGHHTEHAAKERLYREDGFAEFAFQLLNTPESVIAEGIATTAEEMIFSPDELIRFRREQVYPAAGIAGDPEREIAIGEALETLRAVPGNAALLLHENQADEDEVVSYLRRYGLTSEAEARQRLRFIADPLFRAYIFTYFVGYDLVSSWLRGASTEERALRFRTLLTEPVYPSQIAAWSAGTSEASPA
jgi:hypothetical protein